MMPKILLLIMLLLIPVAAHATVQEIWVDSTWQGTQTGYVSSEPWCALDWVLINYFISDGNVDLMIHFSAVNKTSDGNAAYTGNSGGGCSGGASAGHIDMSAKCITRSGTGTPCTHSIYFDGSTLRNTTTYPTAPNWVANTTNYRAYVLDVHGQNSSHLLLSNYTFDGFYFTGYDKLFTVCGNNVTLKNSYLTYPADAAGDAGPAVLIAPSSDGFHEGSADWCPQMDNVIISNNVILDAASEAVYVGGGGCRTADSNAYYNGSGATITVVNNSSGSYVGRVTITAAGTGYVVNQILYVPGFALGGASNNANDLYLTITSINGSGGVTGATPSGSAAANSTTYTSPTLYTNCNGFPSHTNIEVSHNQISFPNGYRGKGENDGIDLKAGLNGVLVHDNYIHDLIYFRSIVMLGTSVVDTTPDNRFYNNWLDNSNNQDAAISVSNTWGTPKGIHIFNNVISNQGGGGIHTEACSTPFDVANNTIYNNTTHTVPGNPTTIGYGLLVACGTPKNNALLANTTTVFPGVTGANSAFDGTYTGCATACLTGLTSAAFNSVSTNDFRLPTTSSALYHAGADLSSLSITPLNSDFNSVARGSNWDIGGYQYITRPTPGNSGTITTASVTSTTLTLNWTTTGTGTDQYLVCQSLSNNITSPLQCQSAKVINDYTTNIATFAVTNLTDATSYYFNVIVKTTAGGNNAYTPVNVTTGSGCTPSKVVFTAQPADAAVGVALGTVTVAVQSSGSSTCTSSTAAITLANTGGTCTGMTLGGTASGNATAGLFTTTNLTENASGSCTITATSSGLTSAISNSFTITLAPTLSYGIGRAMRGPR